MAIASAASRPTFFKLRHYRAFNGARRQAKFGLKIAAATA
jgi:hypothetical protein